MVRMLVLALMLAACGREARSVGPDQPATPPVGPNDLRTAKYQNNVAQVSQGGRYFAWYGCSACHGADATGVRDLHDGRWKYGGAVDQVYAAIADLHGAHAYRARISAEQLWQLTAYTRDLTTTDRGMRRRRDGDQMGEPAGDRWSGAVR